MKSWLVKDHERTYGVYRGMTMSSAIMKVLIEEVGLTQSDVSYNSKFDYITYNSRSEYIEKLLDSLTAYTEEVIS